uniref:Uncharacterized protein n=1 Tax=Oryza glumipatula TaxID=40148 RepID=A0A0E0A104_9ORYZ
MVTGRHSLRRKRRDVKGSSLRRDRRWRWEIASPGNGGAGSFGGGGASASMSICAATSRRLSGGQNGSLKPRTTLISFFLCRLLSRASTETIMPKQD